MEISGLKTWNRSNNLFFNGGLKTRKEDYLEFDLSKVRILHAGVDTIRQLVSGVINPSTLAMIDSHIASGFQYSLVLGEYEFKISKSGSGSGYQYILKNLREGFVCLFKRFYAESDQETTHLKIEYTPQFIAMHDAKGIDSTTEKLANIFYSAFKFDSLAVHLAVDIKGFQIPENLEQRLKTKAKRSYCFSGIDDLKLEFGACAIRYGSNDSYTFGSTQSIQFCMYDKTKEAERSDKINFWTGVWDSCPSVADPFVSEFQKGDSVVRLEARFHQKVIKEFCEGTKGMVVTNFAQLEKHLTGLWQYFLLNFRLHHNKKFIDPLWQLLHEDIVFNELVEPMIYKRSYKKQTSKSKRNVAFWMGNAMRLFARNNYTVDHVCKYFLDSGLLSELKEYFKLLPNATSEDIYQVLFEFVDRRMNELWLDGAAEYEPGWAGDYKDENYIPF